ncbi:MAG: hypothetical protein DRP84_01450 [Spirochaetes bacterium]|nr:MAG: hypothetical protein DRP84_01450 [Spirochaetota bacterium]
MKRINIKYFAILLLLIILLIVARFSFWNQSANNAEFLFRGVLAKDLTDGLKTNLLFYRMAPHEGAETLVGFVGAFFFSLFGDSFLSLFMVLLFFQCLILCFIYIFTAAHFNLNSAVIAGFLYVLVPYSFIHHYDHVLGYHADSVLFALILFSLFYRVFFHDKTHDVYMGKQASRGARLWLSLLFGICGILSGFALYVDYNFLISLFIMGVLWFFLDPFLFKRRYLYIFLFFFTFGFAPWLLTHGFLKIPGGRELPLYGSGGKVPIVRAFFIKGKEALRTFVFLQYTLMRVFSLQWFQEYFHFYIPKRSFYYIILFSLCSSFIAMSSYVIKRLRAFFSSSKRNQAASEEFSLKEGIVFIYVMFFFLAWCFHPTMWPDEIYLTCAYPFLFILVGIAVDKLWRIKISFLRFRAAGFALLLGIILSGTYFLYDSINTVDARQAMPPDKITKIKGYSLAFYPHYLYRQWNCTDYFISDLWKSTLYFQKVSLNTFFKIFGIYSLNSYYHNWHSLYKSYQFLKDIQPRHLPSTCIAYGITMGDGLRGETFPMIKSILNTMYTKDYQHYFYEGIALSYCNRRYDEIFDDFSESLVDLCVPQEYRHYFYYELGRRIAERHKRNLPIGLSVIEDFHKQYHKYLYKGFVTVLSEDQIADLFDTYRNGMPIVLKEWLYFHYGELFGINTYRLYLHKKERFDTNSLNKYIKKMPDEFLPHFLWGVGKGLYDVVFLEYIGERELRQFQKELKESYDFINEFSDIESEKSFIYDGLGIGLSLSTFGQILFYDEIILENIFSETLLPYIYQGYRRGTILRYGSDEEVIERLIEKHVSLQYRDN